MGSLKWAKSDYFFSQDHYVMLLDFFKDLQSYAFLERVLYKESENQCLHFPRCLCGSNLGIYKMAAVKFQF